METVVIIISVLAGLIGIAGSILPGLPGTPVSWAGLLVLYIWGSGTNAAGESLSLSSLLIWGVVVALVSEKTTSSWPAKVESLKLGSIFSI